jgi:hypothetical protein
MPELTRRYIVMAMATDGPFDTRDTEAPFVLKPWKDPAALRALEAYRDHCYSELAEELTAWIAEISSGPAIRGGVGARNEQHMAAAKSKPGRAGAARHRPRPKVKVKAARRKEPRKKGKRSR